jgi:hypothetical protein
MLLTLVKDAYSDRISSYCCALQYVMDTVGPDVAKYQRFSVVFVIGEVVALELHSCRDFDDGRRCRV